MTDSSTLYEKDFYQWIQNHIKLLREGKLAEIDTELLIDELESMARRDQHELLSHLKILLAHLLKWQFQLKHLEVIWQNFQGQSWKSTIVEQRDQILSQLEMSPSLKPQLEMLLLKAYPKSVAIAIRETGLPNTTFPVTCPYTIQELLDEDFYPNFSSDSDA